MWFAIVGEANKMDGDLTNILLKLFVVNVKWLSVACPLSSLFIEYPLTKMSVATCNLGG
jgi:hypothetical protein